MIEQIMLFGVLKAPVDVCGSESNASAGKIVLQIKRNE